MWHKRSGSRRFGHDGNACVTPPHCTIETVPVSESEVAAPGA